MITQMEVTKNRPDRVTFSPSNKKVTKNGQVKNFRTKHDDVVSCNPDVNFETAPQDTNNYSMPSGFQAGAGGHRTRSIYIYLLYI